jgi:hypothetical protein
MKYNHFTNRIMRRKLISDKKKPFNNMDIVITN